MKKHRVFHIILYIIIAIIILGISVIMCFVHKNPHNEHSIESDADTKILDDTSYAAVESETVPLNGDSVTIKYPSLETASSSGHMTPKENVERINELLREAALKKLHDQYLEDEDRKFTYDITDTVLYRSPGVISSVSKGRLHVESAAHDYVFAYSVNIDENTGELYTFSDIIIDFDYFKEVFLAGKFSLTDGLKEVVDDLGWEYLMNQYNTEYGLYPGVYLNGSKVGIIFEVPYVVGSVAIFTIEKNELGAALAPQFQ